MSETREILIDLAEKVLTAIATIEQIERAASGVWLADGWAMVEEAGFPMALVPEEHGGPGVAPEDALQVVRMCGKHAVPLPLPETMYANWLISSAGMVLQAGALGLSTGDERDQMNLYSDHGRYHITGCLHGVPWGREAEALIAVPDGGGHLVRIPKGHFSVVEHMNLAGEPRDEVRVDTSLSAEHVALVPGLETRTLCRAGAALRSISCAGAVERLLEMTLAYSGQRVQFGQAIGSFQVIQQSLSMLAEQCALADAGSRIAIEALTGDMCPTRIGIAKVLAGESAGKSSAIAHQVHGAIGVTREYGLHHITRRLWAWRDEFGNEQDWSCQVGSDVMASCDDAWEAATAL